MIKNKRQIDLTEVLDVLKASVFDLYKHEKKVLGTRLKTKIAGITTEDLFAGFGKTQFYAWLKLNAHYKIFNYQNYLEWLEKEIQVHDRNGELLKRLAELPVEERKQRKSFLNYWKKLHHSFFNQLGNRTLELLDAHYEKMHFMDKAEALPYSEPESQEVKEDVRLEFFDFVQKRTASENPLSGTDKAIGFMMHSISKPITWNSMLNLLAETGYISIEYYHNDLFINTWLSSSLTFGPKRVLLLPRKIKKLYWTGQVTAFAVWILAIKSRTLDYNQPDNRELLKWIELTIDYPGNKRALRSAISDYRKYKGKYFTISGTGKTFSFNVIEHARASRF